MNRLVSSPQWLLPSWMSGDNRRLKRGSRSRADDNRDNGDKNYSRFEYSSKWVPTPSLNPPCLTLEERHSCMGRWHSFAMADFINKRKEGIRGLGIKDDRIYLQKCTSGRTEEKSWIHVWILHVHHTKHPFWIWIHQCKAAIRAPPSPHFLSNPVFWIEHVAGAGRLQQRKKGQKREGMKRERGRVGGGVIATAVRAVKQIQWRNPPSSQMNIVALLPPPPPVSIAILPTLSSSSLLLHYSSVRSESPAHGSSCCCCSSRSTEPAGSPPHTAELQRLLPSPSIHPSIARHGDSELALFCCWEEDWAIIKLLS